MRWRSVLSEAVRNVASGTTRAAVFALALAVIGGGLAVADARSIVALERRAVEFVESGASVRTLNAEGMTDGRSCDRLGEVAGVRGAGALVPADPVVLEAMFANPIPAYEVTPGLADVLRVRAVSAEGVWLPADLARTLGVRAGETLATTAGPLTVAGTYPYPQDGRDGRLRHAVLVPRPAAGTFDECWAEVWPLSESADALVYAAAAVRPGTTSNMTLGRLNNRFGASFDGVGEFTGRATRYGLPACALAGLVLGFVAVRLRRLEYAGALHVGVSRRALLGSTVVETAAWSLAALALSAGALALTVTVGNPADRLEVYLIDIRGPLAAVCAAQVGAVAALLLVREKHLFGYFKNR
ncbi:hypothetical protein [Marinitenerispora sediminis]|uniref:ABC transporter permease n=1 Tax=Marinitenerispora sediminis TaxID=1931232 RepID=A0A368T2R5_9ACTN|nr:hypothetical protein [Marinitenerispora sediminis]RCV55489.1 hypothetical protein DEF24_17800 [Marinitenerispora sediminis]RCV57601.1 hypothetical protein DEF28_01410 [Marinitenerispora sediminis]RCV59652.1 hypothetical protein DEF23_06650 [Marinitenerispora sediminis]